MTDQELNEIAERADKATAKDILRLLAEIRLLQAKNAALARDGLATSRLVELLIRIMAKREAEAVQ